MSDPKCSSCGGRFYHRADCLAERTEPKISSGEAQTPPPASDNSLLSKAKDVVGAVVDTLTGPPHVRRAAPPASETLDVDVLTMMLNDAAVQLLDQAMPDEKEMAATLAGQFRALAAALPSLLKDSRMFWEVNERRVKAEDLVKQFEEDAESQRKDLATWYAEREELRASLLRAQTRLQEIETALANTGIGGIMDEFRDVPDAITQMALHIRELEPRNAKLERDLAQAQTRRDAAIESRDIEWERRKVARAESSRLRSQVSALEAALKDYELLKQAVNDSPTCNGEHDETCPGCDPARWLIDQQARIAALEASQRALLPSTEEPS